MIPADPQKQREFATRVVRRLREAGFEAYWAGGCVRDQLLGRVPRDYDVATSARPHQVRKIFGYRRTIPVGAAFGVITLLGQRGEGEIQIATFRRDDRYSDGRHPDQVHFSTPEEDAKRRDFTINGLFFDPLNHRVIDFVGGQEDLRQRMIRAIGEPYDRFQEDKLRLLRAVRFAATFGFQIEAKTFEAIRRLAPEIVVVSAERIAQEMERILCEADPRQAIELMWATSLARAVIPEIFSENPRAQTTLRHNLELLKRLDPRTFPLALAILLEGLCTPEEASNIGRRWRLSNQQVRTVAWLLENRLLLEAAPRLPWSRVQPAMLDRDLPELLRWAGLLHEAGELPAEVLAWWQEKSQLPQAVLNPPPVLTGEDLKEMGIVPGPLYRRLLHAVRCAQLDRQIATPAEARELVQRLAAEMCKEELSNNEESTEGTGEKRP